MLEEKPHSAWCSVHVEDEALCLGCSLGGAGRYSQCLDASFLVSLVLLNRGAELPWVPLVLSALALAFCSPTSCFSHRTQQKISTPLTAVSTYGRQEWALLILHSLTTSMT